MTRFKTFSALIAGVLTLTGTLALAGCASDTDAAKPAPDPKPTVNSNAPAGSDAVEDFLTANGLAGKSANQIVDHLDQLGGSARPTNYMASIRADEIVFITDDGEMELAMPEDEFYVSIAPFRENTHPCTFHSLTTCQGELTGEDFQVEVKTDAGEVILDEQRTSFQNGFIGLWLPRDITGTITITDDAGQAGQVEFATDSGGATCITTLQIPKAA
ncbi:MAG TPA: CueP family metal-binding protein [Actinomycetales bacterium]|nr:CueP family metal-binding protein [Actinomycetales bacterium]